jgi:methylthioribose-1-phosphate isomerase
MYPVIEWKNSKVYMIDQRLLPVEEKIIVHKSYKDIAESIKSMVIRGAPAIGVATAMGIALGVIHIKGDLEKEYKVIRDTLAETRPTAVNLFWALNRMDKVFNTFKKKPNLLKEKIIAEAKLIDRQDVDINKLIGKNGQTLIKNNTTVLTHCNAGLLATAGYGTALGVIRAAVEHNKNISVIAGETRPFLQGARLTVWELQKDNIRVKLATDNMIAYLMQQGLINSIVVGADRIAKNGDVANKIGTYSIAVLAKYHKIPFYVAAPLSTIDISKETGNEIPIENRDKNEVLSFRGQKIARDETEVFNPAFDISPHNLITAIITEKKIIYPDFTREIHNLFN